MSMLPKPLRFWLFDALSRNTLRHVGTVPSRRAQGLVATVYHQIQRDFFINGSLTSRSLVPEIFAATWAAGREAILVDDRPDRTTKEAMAAALSSIDDCPYCGDMLVSLVHAGDQRQAAMQIFEASEDRIDDPRLRDRPAWDKVVATPAASVPASTPLATDQLPEAIATLMAMGDINRFSHIVTTGSPVDEPLGLGSVKCWAMRRFGDELRENHREPLSPGDDLRLLPDAELPPDMHRARANRRIVRTLAGWHEVIARQAAPCVDATVRHHVEARLAAWHGAAMPISRRRVEDEIVPLPAEARPVARLALLLAKAPYQVEDGVTAPVLAHAGSEEAFVRILSWRSYTAARRVAGLIPEHCAAGTPAVALAA